MADNMKILISAALDLNRAEKDINKSIEQLSKHPSLQKLKLNITINDDFIKNLSSFSKNLNLITSQINQQSSANNTLNNGLNNTTKNINEQIKVTNEAIAAEKKWQIEREKTNSKGIKTTTYGSTETNAKQVVTTLPDGSIKNIDNIQNQIKDAKELQSLINKMAEGRIASESRVRDFQRQWNQNQLNEITKNSKTELALAEQMAQGRIAAESKTRDFERQWNESQQRAIQNNADLERTEITRTQQTRKAYEDWYLKAIREREIQDAKTYTNLNSKLSTSKTTAVAGVENVKALDLLNRKYDEVAQRIAMIQSSGRQLTDSELNGINRRIKALNDLASRQMKAEQELITIQAKAEQKVASLSSAYSKIDTTKLNLLLTQLKNLTTSTDNYKAKAAQLVAEIRQIGDEARATSAHTRTFGDSLKSAMSNILLYSGVGSVFFGITSALKEMTRTIIDVDSQLTQLRRVMDEDTDFDSMLEKSIELANELGRSIKEVNENAIGFARMGFDESQTIELAKTATLFQNISDLTPAEAVDTLTSAMTVFNVEAGKSIEVANKINEVDNNFAISSQNIALSITKAGASAKAFGVTMEELIGNTTAITTATRESGSVVGNSLKTIYSRLTTMKDSESVLAGVGVQMRDLSGETRDVSDILGDLANKWTGLSKEQQQNTAVSLAGRFQLSRFLALMQNFQISVNATETALHSQSSATSENEKYMQSLEARIQKMKTAWDTLSLSVGNSLISDSIVVLTSLMSGLGSALTKTVDTFGALPVIFGVIASGVYLLNASFKAFIINLFGITTSASAASGALSRMAVVLGAVKIGLRALLVSSLVGVAFAGLGFILEKIIGHFSNASEVIDDTGTSLDKLKDKTGSLKELQELSNEYDNLTKKTILNTEEKIRLASVESDLAAKHGITMSTVEDQTVAVKENTLAIGDRIKALKEEAAIEQQKALDEYKANKTAINSEIESQQTKKNSAQAEIDSLSKMQEQLETNIANKQTIKNDQGQLGKFAPYQLEVNPSDYDTSGLDVISESIAQAILDAKDKFDAAGTEFDKAVSKREQAFKAQFGAYADTIEAGGTEVKASTRVLADGFASIMATAKTDDLEVLAKYKNEVFNIFQNTKVNNMDDAIAALERFASAGKLTKDQFNILQTSISQLNFQGVNDGVEGVADDSVDAKDKVLSLVEAMKALDDTMNGSSDEMTAFAKSISASSDEMSLLASAQNELKDSNVLSIDTIEKMNEKYGDFIKVTGLSKDKVLEFIQSKKDEKIAVVTAEIAMTKQAINGAKKRVEAMEIEVAAINKKKKALTQERIDSLSASVVNGTISEAIAEKQVAAIMRNGDDQVLDLSIEKAGLDALSAKLSILNSVKEDFITTANKTDDATDDNTDANKENYDSISDTVEILTDLQKSLISIQKLRDEEENKRSRLRKGSQEYRDSLAKENKLIQEQIKLRKEGIANPSQLVSTKVTTTVKTKAGEDSSSTGSSSSSSGVSNLLASASALQGQFKYKQVAGEYKGTFDQFVEGATSDCSQFVQEMFKEFLNTTLPRTAAEQAKQGVAISKEQLQAGDLVFFNTTGKDNSHVGIYQGNGKFIQMGNSGLKESDLDSSYWSGKYQGARRVTGSGSTSTASSSTGNSTSKVGGTTVKTNGATAKEMQDAVDNAVAQNTADANTIYQNNILQLDSIKEKYDRLVASAELQIEASKKVQETLDPNSVEWRKENNKQINIQTQIQSLKAQEKSNLQTMMKSLGVSSDEYDDYLKQLSTDWLDVQADKIVKMTENINSQISNFNDQLSESGEAIDTSNAKLELMVEGSAEYRKEVLSQIPILQKQQDLRQKEIDFIKDQLKNEKLTIASKKELSNQLHQLELDWLSNEKAIKNVTKTLIDFSSKALSSLFDTLKSSIGPDSLLDLSEFSDSIDSIIATLDEADKKYLTNVSFVDTTSSTRSDLSDYASKVKDIAAQVKSALNYYQDMDNVSFSNLSSLSDQINSQVALISSLKTKLDEVNNTVRDTELRYSKEEAALSELIKTREKYYDSQIEAQQTVLDNLDEQIEKEDRVKALQDINDELNKVKNDKRFEYVTESGELILTYDKARVDELEKQKDDLVKQYEREDVKSAIQDEIDRLQKAKDSEVEILNENLEKTKAIHQADLEALKLYQSSLSSLYDQTVTDTQNKLDQFQAAIQQGLEDGTITAAQATSLLEGVVNNWQNLSLSNWDTYINQVISKLEKLKQLYTEMANAANAAMSQSSSSSSSNVDPNSPNYYVLSQAEQDKLQAEKDKVVSTPIMEQMQEAVKGKHWDGHQWVYHTGGTAGKEPLKSNEVPAILEDGELVLTKNHQDILKNMFSRSRDIVGSVMSNLSGAMSGIAFNKSAQAVAGGPSYTFTGPITVKADNPTEFLTGLEHLITSQRR